MFNRHKLPADELRELYTNQGLTMTEIAEQFNVSETTVRRRLNELGIISRPRGPKVSRDLSHLELTEDALRELYLERKLSIPQIAELCGWGRETIRQRLIENGIPIRSFSQAHLVQHGTWDEYKDFSGDPFEKAYMIGFRLGDLSATRQHEQSEVIRLGCTSSKSEQIELIEQVYGKYGHIVRTIEWRLSLRGLLRCQQIAISLNQTFEFLLERPVEIPAWILGDPNLFLSFFGGFTDAEGSFHLQNYEGTVARGRFSIKNTDKQILEQCRAELIALGIRCSSVTKVYNAGRQTSKRGVFATKALWEFAVEAKDAVLELIQLIAPYLRHEKRRADMERVRENVEWRNSKEFRDEATKKRVAATRATNEAKKKNRN
jgi:AraC-like DNA-binding protein